MITALTSRARGLAATVVDTLRTRRLALPRVVTMITPIGWCVVVAGVLAAAGGWRLGWLELRVIAMIALVTLLVALGFVARRSELTGELRVLRQRVTIGDEAMGQVLVRSRRKRGVLGQVVELPVGKAVARFFLPGLGGDEAHEELFSVAAKRRAVIPVGPVRAVQADPLGLVRREKQLTDQIEVFVHPQIAGIDSGAIGLLRDIEGVTTQNLTSSDVAFHALRDYVPGDDRRAVHWRTTARTGRLTVRQFEETMRVHLLIVLSLNPQVYASEADFELAVSSVASLGMAALREERQVTVWTTSGQVRYPSSIGLLDELCRVARQPGQSLRTAVAEGVRNCPDASAVALVTGGECTNADIRGAEVAVPVDLARFALRAATAQPIRRSVIGRLTLLDIARLGDLGPALRSVR